MSNATALLFVPRAPTVVRVPSFGGFWVTSAWRALSMSKSVVDVAPAKLFV
jgi:hypothetical protein